MKKLYTLFLMTLFPLMAGDKIVDLETEEPLAAAAPENAEPRRCIIYYEFPYVIGEVGEKKASVPFELLMKIFFLCETEEAIRTYCLYFEICRRAILEPEGTDRHHHKILFGCDKHKIEYHPTTVTLADRDDIKDAAIISLAKMPTLQSLELSGCTQLTDAAIIPLATAPCLQRLELIDCDQLTDAAIIALEKAPNLQELDITACPKITNDATERLERAKPDIVILP